MKNEAKLYAVVMDGRVIGTYLGPFISARVSVAGAVARDGSPVNRSSAMLSASSRDIDYALQRDLPEFSRREHAGREFITSWYDEKSGGYYG